MMVISAGIDRMLVRIANREDPDQTASSIYYSLSYDFRTAFWVWFGNVYNMGENSKVQKSLTFETQIFKHGLCLQSINNFKFKWSIALIMGESSKFPRS